MWKTLLNYCITDAFSNSRSIVWKALPLKDLQIVHSCVFCVASFEETLSGTEITNY